VKLNWRALAAMANREAVDRARKKGAATKLPPKVVKAAKKKLRNPHTDGPHSLN
jgi:hypothetical protein